MILSFKGFDQTPEILYDFELQIFTDDIPEVESLPRDKVLAHLEGNAKLLVMPYLVSLWMDHFKPMLSLLFSNSLPSLLLGTPYLFSLSVALSPSYIS